MKNINLLIYEDLYFDREIVFGTLSHIDNMLKPHAQISTIVGDFKSHTHYYSKEWAFYRIGTLVKKLTTCIEYCEGPTSAGIVRSTSYFYSLQINFVLVFSENIQTPKKKELAKRERLPIIVVANTKDSKEPIKVLFENFAGVNLL